MSGATVRKLAGAGRRAADESAREIWNGLLTLVLARKEQFTSALAQLELNAPQALLLRALAPGASVPMCRIASALCCDASNVTNLVDRLELRGLIARQPDPADRRVKNIVLTRSGARLRQQLLQQAFAPPASFESLTPAELEQFEALLRKIITGEAAAGDCQE